MPPPLEDLQLRSGSLPDTFRERNPADRTQAGFRVFHYELTRNLFNTHEFFRRRRRSMLLLIVYCLGKATLYDFRYPVEQGHMVFRGFRTVSSVSRTRYSCRVACCCSNDSSPGTAVRMIFHFYRSPPYIEVFEL